MNSKKVVKMVILGVMLLALAGCISQAKKPWTDEFDGKVDPAWRWMNEDPMCWSLTAPSGTLRIVTKVGASLIEHRDLSNVLLRDAPEGDFEISTKLRSNLVGLTAFNNSADLDIPETPALYSFFTITTQ